MEHLAEEDCLLRLFTVGGSDLLSWYQVWEAVEAVFAICGWKNLGGSYRGLGMYCRREQILTPDLWPLFSK